jgi:DNA repair protein RecN (Recombination protein N)
MIKQLHLSHFVLVENAHIHFSPHFNIITGETGAGKTAIIEGISLCLGRRADTSLIRQGCERAVVEAAFDIQHLASVHTLLEEAGIVSDPDEELLIRREITHEGKNRAYVNCHLVPLPFLQKIGEHLIDFIGQHAILALKSTDFQRKTLDLYANLELSAYREAFEREKALLQRYEELRAKETSREKQQEMLRYQLEEIQAADLKEGEDEALFEKYKRLSNKNAISEKLKEMVDRLAEAPSSLLTQLIRLHKVGDALVRLEPHLQEPFSLIEQAQIALSEAHLQFNSFFASLDQESDSFTHIEDRLSLIARLKKKYGQTLLEIETFKQKLLHDLEEFDHVKILLEETHRSQILSQEETAKLAGQLTERRQEAARDLAPLLTSYLQTLNMSKAQVQIEIVPQNRTSDGDDAVQFWLKANPGEQPALVREHSSGGELSRLFLAIKLALADKNKTPTLIFDEIDANVGGKTASLIGEKLAELGKTRQILCITHFPQVASKADAHFSVLKEEIEDRTVTQITLLSKKEREKELLRMLGGDRTFVS